jgi:hypothetical protein
VNDGPLVAHQLRYDLLVNWRNPQSRFFTIVLPVIFLVLLTSLFGNGTTHVNGTPPPARQSGASPRYVQLAVSEPMVAGI